MTAVIRDSDACITGGEAPYSELAGHGNVIRLVPRRGPDIRELLWEFVAIEEAAQRLLNLDQLEALMRRRDAAVERPWALLSGWRP